MDLKKKLQFILPNGRKWVITKEFNDERHCYNFINRMNYLYSYALDEIWDVTDNQ
jgi:hypothetical protein